MAASAGRGYVDATGSDTNSGVTYVDLSSPCDATGLVTSITVNIGDTDDGQTLKIGCGSFDNPTFTPRHYVEIDIDGDAEGLHTYTSSGGDFTAFQIFAGDYLFFYSDTTYQGGCALTTTTSGSPLGWGSRSGDHMASTGFNIIGTSSTEAIEFECTGALLGICGIGEFVSNSPACADGNTYCDTQYPANTDFSCTEIYVNNDDAGTNFTIGHGTISGSTFYPIHYVTLGTLAVGENTFTAPTDFTAFSVSEGDYLFFYASYAEGRPRRTYNANPEGYGYASGDQMDASSFGISTDSTITLLVQLSGDVSGGNVTLTADTGTLSLSGSADLIHDWVIPAATGTISISGQAAALIVDRTLPAATGTLVLSGAAALLESKVLAADTGTLVLSGAADLVVSINFTCDTGTIVLSGAADFVIDWVLSADTGTITLSGAASLERSILLAAETGSIALSGAATLLADRVLAASIGTLSLSGAAALVEAKILAAATGTLSLSGQAALLASRLLAAATGSLTLSGSAALIEALILDAEIGALVLSGAADLVYSGGAILTADIGVLVLSGNAELSLAAILSPFLQRKDFYAMRQIKYNTATVPVHFEFPIEWAAEDLTEITLTVKDRLGTTIRSPEAMTLYTATTLGAAAARFAGTITLATGASAPSQGDLLLLSGAAGAEKVRVKGYDSTTRVVELENTLDNAHDLGDDVTGCFADIDIDTTDTDVFGAGLVMTFIWTPTGTGAVTTEAAKVAVSVLDVEGLDRRFARIYTRAYDAFTKPVDRLQDMLDEAERQLRLDLRARNLDYDRIIDQDIIAPALMAKMAWLWALNGDQAHDDERRTIGLEYNEKFETILRMPIWQDFDQDYTQEDDDAGETTDHEPLFEGGW